MILPQDVVQRARPHAIGQRARERALPATLGPGLVEEVHCRSQSGRAASQAGSAARSDSAATGRTPQRARSASFARYAMNGTPALLAAKPSTHESPTI